MFLLLWCPCYVFVVVVSLLCFVVVVSLLCFVVVVSLLCFVVVVSLLCFCCCGVLVVVDVIFQMLRKLRALLIF